MGPVQCFSWTTACELPSGNSSRRVVKLPVSFGFVGSAATLGFVDAAGFFGGVVDGAGFFGGLVDGAAFFGFVGVFFLALSTLVGFDGVGFCDNTVLAACSSKNNGDDRAVTYCWSLAFSRQLGLKARERHDAE